MIMIFLGGGRRRMVRFEDIVSISKYHNNDDRLKWNLYNIPIIAATRL